MTDAIKLGILGGGQMAEAIIRGLCAKAVVPAECLFVSDHKAERAEELRKRYGVQGTTDTKRMLQNVDVLILAVKPQSLVQALSEIKEGLPAEALLISIVAGAPISCLEAGVPNRIVRVMPNTPLSVGAGMSVFSLGHTATEQDAERTRALFGASGEVICLPESSMDAVTGLSGSGPAFVLLILEAMADGGVAAGLKKQDALVLAAQTILGTAQMVSEMESHPAILRDAVTSPAGTTIAGLRVLENRGVRGALLDAVLSAANRSKELGKA